MERDNLLATIGMPVYNGEKYIKEALDSVLLQTYKNFELIISDNGSTDKTEEICLEYAKKDSRIKYVRHPENKGGYFNFGYCVQNAKGVYFTWIAHDDILEENFLEQTCAYMAVHKECVLVSGDFELIDDKSLHIDNLELNKTREELAWRYRCRELFKYPSSSRIYFLMYGLMRTEMIKKVHPTIYKIKFIRGSEMPLLCRIAVEGPIVSIPGILRKFRMYQESSSKSEWLSVNKKSFLERRYTLFINVMQVRFDQLRVLLGSNYVLSQKLYVLFWVYFQYFKNSLTRLKRSPKKIYNGLCSLMPSKILG